jgi:hypothetical protein
MPSVPVTVYYTSSYARMQQRGGSREPSPKEATRPGTRRHQAQALFHPHRRNPRRLDQTFHYLPQQASSASSTRSWTHLASNFLSSTWSPCPDLPASQVAYGSHRALNAPGPRRSAGRSAEGFDRAQPRSSRRGLTTKPRGRGLMEMWTTLRRLRLAHISTAPTTTAWVPHHRQPEAFPNCKYRSTIHTSCTGGKKWMRADTHNRKA